MSRLPALLTGSHSRSRFITALVAVLLAVFAVPHPVLLAADGDAIDTAFQFALARRPPAEERAILQDVHDAASVAGATAGAMALATDPIGPLPEGMDPIEAIAMTVTCNVILNLDEFVNRP
mgnify:CR=1 FL=1